LGIQSGGPREWVDLSRRVASGLARDGASRRARCAGNRKRPEGRSRRWGEKIGRSHRRAYASVAYYHIVIDILLLHSWYSAKKPHPQHRPFEAQCKRVRHPRSKPSVRECGFVRTAEAWTTFEQWLTCKYWRQSAGAIRSLPGRLKSVVSTQMAPRRCRSPPHKRSFRVGRKPVRNDSAGTMRGRNAHEPTLKSDPSHAQGKGIGHPQKLKQIPRAAALVMRGSEKGSAGWLEV